MVSNILAAPTDATTLLTDDVHCIIVDYVYVRILVIPGTIAMTEIAAFYCVYNCIYF